MDVNTYTDRDRAERASAKRSLFAALRGECSQVEVRQLGPKAFVGGYPGDLAKRFPSATVAAQYSGGYRV